MKRAAVLMLLVAGCGGTPVVVTEGGPGRASPTITQIPQIIDREDSVLSWGHFGGNGFFGESNPMSLVDFGGPIDVIAFERISQGVYEVTYDVDLRDVWPVATVATGMGIPADLGYPETSNFPNGLHLIGVTPILDRTAFTVRVVSTSTMIDQNNGYSLGAVDAIFNLVIFGDPID